MKWACLMVNMVVPGVGSLIARRYWTGAVQAVGSLVGMVMFGFCVREFHLALKDYAGNIDDIDALITALGGLGDKITQPLILGGVGILIFKVMWIWAMVTTARVFKAEKETEAQAIQPPSVDFSN